MANNIILALDWPAGVSTCRQKSTVVHRIKRKPGSAESRADRAYPYYGDIWYSL